MTRRNQLFLILPLFVGNAAVAQEYEIDLAIPRDRAGVPSRACMAGVTSKPKAKLVAVIHPMSVSEYNVQPDITVRGGGKFKMQAYFGEPGLHAGEHFEVRLFSNPHGNFKEGQKLKGWPEAEGYSPVIEVVRDDAQPDGCDQAGLYMTGTAPNSLPGVSTTRAVSRPPGVGQPAVVRPQENAFPCERVRCIIDWVGAVARVLLIVLFVALVVMPDRAEAGSNCVIGWLIAFLHWLVSIAKYAASSIAGLWHSLCDRSANWASPIWAAKGTNANLQQFALCLLAMVPLQVAAVLASYGEANTIVKGLNATFGVESSQTANAPSTGLVTSLMAVEGKPPAGEEESRGSFVTGVAGRLGRLVTAFETLWERETLGFLAISLSCLQGAFGIVLLWQMGISEPLRLRPLALLRQRLLLTLCFLTLNLGLTVLAANRGFELSPEGMRWAVPSFVSGAIALAMPWIMTFTQHYALECAAFCLGIVKAIVLIACLVALTIFTTAAWTLLLFVGLAVVGVVFAAFFCFCVVACAFLLLANILGELARKFPLPSFVDRRVPAHMKAIPATVISLVLVTGAYYIFRGLV